MNISCVLRRNLNIGKCLFHYCDCDNCDNIINLAKLYLDDRGPNH